MNTGKPTPGPWSIAPFCNEEESSSVHIVAEYRQVGAKHVAHWIAECDIQDCDETNWANARLIAAAPDLLEALVAMNALFANEPSLHWEHAEILAAKAAIAKAKGESK